MGCRQLYPLSRHVPVVFIWRFWLLALFLGNLLAVQPMGAPENAT